MSGYSQAAKDTRLKPSQRDILVNRLDDIAPLLDLESPFTINDTERDVRDAIMLLKQNGAIESVAKEQRNYEYDGQDNQVTNSINVWRWHEGTKDWLQQTLADRDELPCGHKVHIFNPKGVDGLSCKYCPEDSKPEYSKEQVKQLL
jgi:hypothetical protein